MLKKTSISVKKTIVSKTELKLKFFFIRNTLKIVQGFILMEYVLFYVNLNFTDLTYK